MLDQLKETLLNLWTAANMDTAENYTQENLNQFSKDVFTALNTDSVSRLIKAIIFEKKWIKELPFFQQGPLIPEDNAFNWLIDFHVFDKPTRILENLFDRTISSTNKEKKEKQQRKIISVATSNLNGLSSSFIKLKLERNNLTPLVEIDLLLLLFALEEANFAEFLETYLAPKKQPHQFIILIAAHCKSNPLRALSYFEELEGIAYEPGDVEWMYLKQWLEACLYHLKKRNDIKFDHQALKKRLKKEWAQDLLRDVLVKSLFDNLIDPLDAPSKIAEKEDPLDSILSFSVPKFKQKETANKQDKMEPSRDQKAKQILSRASHQELQKDS